MGKSPTKTLGPVPFSVCSDPNWTLRQWQVFIARLIDEHGPDAKMRTDGDYNNVDLELTPHG